MPKDMQPGDYVMQVSIDSKSSLGVIKAQKSVSVREASSYETLVREYSIARSCNDTKKQAQIQSELLVKAFTTRIKPGQACTISGTKHTTRGEFPGADKVSATVKWFPDKNQLRVKFDVVDAFFSTKADPRYPWDASCVGVYMSPTGLQENINQLFFVPDGKDGTARLVQEIPTLKNPENIKASWKRNSKGYTMDIRIPWSCIGSYKAGWKVMPVSSLICSKPPDKYRVQVVMDGSRLLWETTETYVGLTPK